MIGLLQAQYCLAGYDAAAHMSEETKRADVAGPWGMVGALVGSSFLGWFFVVALLMGVKDYEATVDTNTGFAVTQILLDNFGRTWTLLCMCLLLVACWLCGLLTVTSNSRMIYAFSRDYAMVNEISLSANHYHRFSFATLAVESFVAHHSSYLIVPNLWCLALMPSGVSSRPSLFNQFYGLHRSDESVHDLSLCGLRSAFALQTAFAYPIRSWSVSSGSLVSLH